MKMPRDGCSMTLFGGIVPPRSLIVFVDVLNARGYRISPVMKPISITMPLRLSSRPAATTDRSERSSLVGPWAGRRAGVEVVGALVAVSMINPPSGSPPSSLRDRGMQ
jgi:hypothetical protein